MMKSNSLSLLVGFLSASCASDQATNTTPEIKPLSQRLEEKHGYGKDAEGNWAPRSDKRSSFENQGEAAYFQKKFEKQEFKTGDYTKKSWWGNKDFGRKPYAGNTDGSKFETPSNLQDQGAREAGSTAKIPGTYQTQNYTTSAASESSNKLIDKPSNTGIENNRETFQQPEIIDWREQRSLSVDQSRGILGR